MKVLQKLRHLYNLSIFSSFSRYYGRLRNYTMLPRTTFVRNLLLCAQYEDVQGAIVECGVWRGGMLAGMACVLGTNRRYVAFDSFEGLPEAKKVDGKQAIEWQADKNGKYYYDNCKAEQQWVEEAMRISGAENFQAVKGWFSQSLPDYKIEGGIAILRLDGDWYESTFDCLTHLFGQVTPGGIIILDDYESWEGCRKAVHDFLSQEKSSSFIRQFDNNIHYIVKF